MPIMNIKLYAIVAVILATLFGFMSYRITSLKSEVAAKDKAIIQLQVYNAEMVDSVNKQNEAVDKLLNEAKANEAKNKEALDKAKQLAVKNKALAANSLTRVKPENVSACDYAKQLIIEELENVE